MEMTYSMGLKSGDKGGELGLEFRDPLGVGLDGRRVDDGLISNKQLLKGHVRVADDCEALVIRPGHAVFGSRPDHAGVGVDVFHVSMQ